VRHERETGTFGGHNFIVALQRPYRAFGISDTRSFRIPT
jgi:hypothetical protein